MFANGKQTEAPSAFGGPLSGLALGQTDWTFLSEHFKTMRLACLNDACFSFELFWRPFGFLVLSIFALHFEFPELPSMLVTAPCLHREELFLPLSLSPDLSNPFLINFPCAPFCFAFSVLFVVLGNTANGLPLLVLFLVLLAAPILVSLWNHERRFSVFLFARAIPG